MDTVIKKRFRQLPWDNPLVSGDPWHLHGFYANADTGNFYLLDYEIKKERDQQTGQTTLVRSADPKNRMKGGEPDYLDRQELTRVYQIAATEEIPLMDAFIQLRGEEHFAPKWLERAKKAHQHWADPKYATAKKQPKPVAREELVAESDDDGEVASVETPKRGRGRPRKES